MFFSKPMQWYHSHADPIWPDGTFNMVTSKNWTEDTELFTPPLLLADTGTSGFISGHLHLSSAVK